MKKCIFAITVLYVINNANTCIGQEEPSRRKFSGILAKFTSSPEGNEAAARVAFVSNRFPSLIRISVKDEELAKRFFEGVLLFGIHGHAVASLIDSFKVKKPSSTEIKTVFSNFSNICMTIQATIKQIHESSTNQAFIAAAYKEYVTNVNAFTKEAKAWVNPQAKTINYEEPDAKRQRTQ